VNVPVVAPAATVTNAGTVNAVLFEEIATTAPPAGAALESVTVQDDVPPDITDAGAHASVVTTVGGCVTVIVPPVPVTVAAVPSDSTPIALPIGSERLEPLPVAVNVTVRTAAAPAPIPVAFIPDTRHRTVPVPELQVSVLPALVSAEPAAVVTDKISLVG
jgi:hypothetical protein